MVQAPVYAPGTPIWVDLGSPNVDASRSFYTQLFGWEFQAGPPETGGYSFFTKGGKLVAAVGPLQMAGQPTVWSTYLSTTDAHATAQAVRDAGGQVLVEPMDVMTAGRMAVFLDSTGAAISVWQPGDMQGAELFNAPGSLVWSELNTRDLEASKAFYTRAFGFGIQESEMDGMGPYVQWTVAGRGVAGAMTMPAMVPAEVPSFWLTYFAVEDCDATVAKAKSLGASVRVGPVDSPVGRFAVLVDPQGATFAAITMSG